MNKLYTIIFPVVVLTLALTGSGCGETQTGQEEPEELEERGEFIAISFSNTTSSLGCVILKKVLKKLESGEKIDGTEAQWAINMLKEIGEGNEDLSLSEMLTKAGIDPVTCEILKYKSDKEVDCN